MVSMETLRGSGRLVHAYLERLAKQSPDTVWLTFLDGPSYTYRQLWDATVRVAGNMQRLGVGRGDRVAIMARNCSELIETWFATHAIGALSVPLNTAVRGSSLRHMMDEASPRMVVVESEFADKFVDAEVLDQSYLDMMIVVGASDAGATDDAKVQGWGDEFEADAPFEAVGALEPWDSSAIVYTSGTTGPPKGIVWTHNMTVHWGEICTRYFEYDDTDVVYVCLPLFHANALNMQLYPALLAGSPVVVSKRFSVGRFWKEIGESKATITNIVGAIAPLLLQQAPSELETQHRLRRICHVPCAPSYYEEFPRRFGVMPYEAFGLSDIGMPIWTPNDRAPMPGSCGMAAPEFECRLVNDLDEDVPLTEIGELVVRPLQPWIGSPGYWENPEATVNSWRNGWFHTGDLLRQDEEGWFYFIDRAKDAMKRRGENVSAFEVEQAFLRHSEVLECAAYAIPSELSEDEIAIAAVLEPDADVDIEELLRFAEPDLPYFAVPRYVRIVSELPKTVTQKVRKAPLRDEGVVEGIWDREAVGYKVSRT